MNVRTELYLRVGGSFYGLTRLHVDPRQAETAWRLRKKTGKEYTCWEDEHGLHCDCKDFIYRREKKGETCKHLASLIYWHMIGRTLAYENISARRQTMGSKVAAQKNQSPIAGAGPYGTRTPVLSGVPGPRTS